MAHSAKKVNFMISDDVRSEFEQLVPPGERSRVVNDALRKELVSIKRKRLTEKLLSLRAKGPAVSTRDIVEAIKKNRLRNS
ncbi:MAG: hypothetical protein AB1480_00240 [Nitrospirota bacterium]